MKWAKQVEVAAPPDVVWEVVADVRRWPERLATVSSLVLEPQGPLSVGSRARVTQPKLGTMMWTVTGLDPGTGFVWVTKRPGITTTGDHRITETGHDTVTLEVSVTFEGFVAPLAARLMGAVVVKNLSLEADGLAKAAEAAASA